MEPFFRDAVVARLRPGYSPAWAWDPFSGPPPPSAPSLPGEELRPFRGNPRGSLLEPI